MFEFTIFCGKRSSYSNLLIETKIWFGLGHITEKELLPGQGGQNYCVHAYTLQREALSTWVYNFPREARSILPLMLTVQNL